MRRFSPYIVALTILALLGLQACAPSSQSNQATPGSADFITTGATVEVKDPETKEPVTTNYTIAGAGDIFEKLRSELSSQTDQFLAFSVKDIRIIPLDKNSKVVREKPERVLVQVDFKHMYRGAQTNLVFNAKLERDGNTRAAKLVRQDKFAEFKNAYTANITCFDENCRIVEVRLQRRDKKENGEPGEINGQIGGLFSLSYPTIEVQRPDDGSTLTNLQLKELERIATTTIAIKTSVVIVNGPAFTRITIPHLADPKKPQEKVKNLLEIETALLDTADVSPQVNKVAFENAEPNVSARLAGNDPDTGSLILDFSVDEPQSSSAQPPAAPSPVIPPLLQRPPTQPSATPAPKVELKKPVQSLRLIIKDSATQVASQPNPANPPKRDTPPVMEREAPRATVQVGMGLWPTSQNNRNGLDAASRFAGYANHPEVQRRVKSFANSQKTKNIFAYAPAVSEPIEKIFEALEMTPEFAYILNLESDYLETGEFNATQVTEVKPSTKNKNPSAFGPWQITNATAIDINKLAPGKPFTVVWINKKVWDPNDDRGFLAQATYMAALRLKSICDNYKNDPAVCVLGYHGGPGVAQDAVTLVDQKLPERITRYNITFAKIAEFHMAKAEQIDYVFNFLAYREVGQNPQKYGLHRIEPANSDKAKVRLNKPDGALPPGVKI